MDKQALFKGYKSAFRDLYNMLLKYAEPDNPEWSKLINEYADIVERFKDTELEKFVASIGINILNELERKWSCGIPGKADKGN